VKYLFLIGKKPDKYQGGIPYLRDKRIRISYDKSVLSH